MCITIYIYIILQSHEPKRIEEENEKKNRRKLELAKDNKRVAEKASENSRRTRFSKRKMEKVIDIFLNNLVSVEYASPPPHASSPRTTKAYA